MEKILTVNDVAEILQVKPITVREMFREKRLRAFKVGKAWRTTGQMLQEDIDALAEHRRPQASLAAESASAEVTGKSGDSKRTKKTAKPSKSDARQEKGSDPVDDRQQMLL